MKHTLALLVALSVLLMALPAAADGNAPPIVPGETVRGPALLPQVPSPPPVVPPEAIIEPPKCTPTPKPVPAWSNYLAWGLESATAIAAVILSAYQRAP